MAEKELAVESWPVLQGIEQVGSNVVEAKENIPEADFCDFKNEKRVGESQVWAAYSGEEALPRLYLWIRRVISETPFEVEVNYLESTTKQNNAVTGKFRLGRLQILNNLNYFSHLVSWQRLPWSSLQIFPMTGQVWAMHTDMRQQYRLVEMVNDFEATLPVFTIQLLQKVVGYNSVFERLPEHVLIPKEQIDRFSHQIPLRVLRHGCLELDPAALPEQLLEFSEENGVEVKPRFNCADFCDFENENKFQESQLWAAYGGDEALPRMYLWIHRVIRETPFEVQVNHLVSITRQNNAVDMKTTGSFRLGRLQILNNLNYFSHLVNWQQLPWSSLQIFPKTGQVWAMHTDIQQQYRLVKMVNDFEATLPVFSIQLLKKVVGYNSVFERLPEHVLIPKEQIDRFSHQIPSRVLTGEEAVESRHGCLELDPAALPEQFLEFPKA